MEISVAGQILTKKNHQRTYRTTIPIPQKMIEKYCDNNQFFGTRAISLLFCVHQDTESEKCEININISEPITTKKKNPKALCDIEIHNLLYWKKYCGSSSYLWI